MAIAYTQLSQLHAPNATLHVDYATHAAVAALANALPTLPSNIKLAIGHLLDLDDANMTHLLRMGQRVSVHECEGIIVQSDQYVNSPWLLPKFHLDSMYVGASFAKLPLPGLVDGKAPRVTYHYLNFSKLPLLSEVGGLIHCYAHTWVRCTHAHTHGITLEAYMVTVSMVYSMHVCQDVSMLACMAVTMRVCLHGQLAMHAKHAHVR